MRSDQTKIAITLLLFEKQQRTRNVELLIVVDIFDERNIVSRVLPHLDVDGHVLWVVAGVKVNPKTQVTGHVFTVRD